jgi:transcription initiation factor TFIIIB Brf1 subunit/transcription initiation factor TFIIB
VLEDLLDRIFRYVRTNGFAFYHDISKSMNVDSAVSWTLLEYLVNQKKIMKFKVGWSYTKNKPVFAYCMDGYETRAVISYQQLLSKFRKDRVIEKYSATFKQACERLKIDNSVADLSCSYLRYSSNVAKGRNYRDVAWSAFYLANKTLRQGLTLGDIESVSGMSRERILTISKLLNSELELEVSDIFPKPSDYLKRILDNLKVSNDVRSRMLEETCAFIESLPRQVLFGRRPEGVAAAALYIVARSTSDYEIRYLFRQNKVAEASDVTEVTLRNMLRRIEESLEGKSVEKESFVKLPEEVVRSESDFNMKECEICGYTEGDGETLTWFANRKCWLCEDCAAHDKLTKSLEER